MIRFAAFIFLTLQIAPDLGFATCTDDLVRERLRTHDAFIRAKAKAMYRDISGYARRLGYGEEDLVVDFQTATWEALEHYNADSGPFEAYLVTCFQYLKIDLIRRAQAPKRNHSVVSMHREDFDLPIPGPEEADLVLAHDTLALVRASLGGLGPARKQHFEDYLSGLSLREIAAKYGLILETVQNSIRESRASVRQVLRAKLGADFSDHRSAR